MATNTYTSLASYTVTGTSTNSVTFTSIPQGYTDLVIETNLSNIGNVAILFGRINGDTGSTYSSVALEGDGSSAFSGQQSNVTGFYMTYQGHINSTKGVGTYHFLNYSNSTTYKTILSRSSNAGFGVDAIASVWRSTAPITSISIFNDRAEYWTAGSTINIYGIAAASVGAKATGGTIYQDASYFYHVFSGNGTFTPSQALSADVLVVAGGGAGGGYDGGGGGAGGLLGFTGQSLASGTGYSVTVGAGGARGTSSSYAGYGSAGGNSQFASLTTCVGGGQGIPGGGTNISYLGASGGSGGGGGSGVGANQTLGGAGTSGQGNAGGNSPGATGTYNSGGGGGAGAAGQTPTAGAQAGGIGGDGSTAYTTWCAATGLGENVSGTWYIAGGGTGFWYSDSSTNATRGGYGGGGSGGMGNGTGAATVSPANGKAGSGGGGGGGYLLDNTNGTNGGSGVVIVRYAK